MKNLYRTIAVLIAPLFLAAGILAASPLIVGASPSDQVTKGIDAAGDSTSKDCGSAGKKRECGLIDSINTLTTVLMFIIGTVAVIMIILGGIRYTTSNGDSSQVTAAKNTIMYSVIGLVVALLAYAIVSFVVTQFTK